MRDGAADAAGGGALEVVHEVVDLLAGGGHDCVCGDGHGKGGIYIGSEEWLLEGFFVVCGRTSMRATTIVRHGRTFL